MITYPDVEDLLDFRSHKQPIISFYLNTDRSRYTLDQTQVAARNLLREGRKSIEGGPWNEAVREDLSKDLARLERYIKDELGPGFPHRGLAVFSCGEAKLWRVFGLPRPVPSSFTLEFTPHIRSLTLILDQYHRFGVLLSDSRAAELFEVYIGEILKLEDAFEATLPQAPPSAAVEHPGSGDRGIARRGEEETQKHLRRVADVLFHQYHRRHYEYIILGGKQQLLMQLENFLHPTLKGLIVGRFPAEPFKTRPAKIMEEVAMIEREVEAESEQRLVKQLVDSAKARGLAVLGLSESLKALQMGAVHQLFVEDGWRKAGVLCRKCAFLGIYEESCPRCSSKTDRVSDVIDEAIESAIRTGSMIEHVNPAAGLAEHGHIGAILRFRIT